MIKRIAALLAGAALAPCAALAQQSAPQTLPAVDIVAPTATASPGSANAAAASPNYTPVPASTIAAQSAASPDAASLMRDVPGVSLRTGGGVSSLPVVNGFDDERNAILVGGMSITAACANHMNPALSYLSSANVGSVQVISANVPVSEGGDSIGGTIIANPRAPVFAPTASPPGLPTLAIAPGVVTSGSLTAMYRSNNKSVSLSGTATAATDHFSIGYAGSWSRAGDYHAGGSDAVVRSTNYEAEYHTLTLAYKGAEDQLITLRGSLQNIPYQGFVNQYMDMLSNRAASVNLDYKGGFAWGQLDANAFYQHVDHYMNFLADKNGGVDATSTTGMPMYTEGQDFGYSVKATIAASKTDTFRFGNEFHGQTESDWWTPVAGSMMMCCGTFENLNGATRDRFGVYGEWEKKWTPLWTTLVGVRGELVSENTGDVQGYNMMMYGADAAAFNAADHAKTFDNLDLTALTRFTPDADSVYEIGYTRKTRAPSLYELYAWSTNTMAADMIGWFGDGNGYVGNLALKPEVAHTISASAEWRDAATDRWDFKATPYYSYVEDYINAGLLSSSMMGNVLQFVNHDAELYGFNLSGRVRLAESESYGVVSLSAQAGYVRGIDLTTGGNLYDMMPLNGKAALEDKIALWGGTWTNTLEVQAVAAKTEVDLVRSEPTTPAYALTNLRSAFEIKNIRFDAGVENVFDKLYYLPLGGVDLTDYQVENLPAPNPVAGMGRTLYAGMTVKF